MIGWEPVVPERRPGLPPLASRRRRGPRSPLVEYPVLIAIAVVVAYVLKALVAQAFFIPSPSMEPQLAPGDRVVVSRLAYRVHEPRRGDIIVFDSPEQEPAPDEALPVRVFHDVLEAVGLRRPPETELIKRVIGLPGETVEGRDGIVHIDGRPLLEPYLDVGVVTLPFGPTEVPADHLFVMGDNRTNSQDSRVIGAIPIDSVVGRAIARVWPPWRGAFL